MSFSAAEEEKENTAPSSSPPLPAPPARKQKHRETKSTFHLLSLFFQRFQGQQSQCGEAWRKTTRGRVWPPDCGVCCGFKGLSGGWGGGGRLRCTPVSLGRWRQKEGRREGGQGLEGRQVGVTGARKLLEVQPFPMCCSSGPSASRCWDGHPGWGQAPLPPPPAAWLLHTLPPPPGPAQSPHQASGLFRKMKPAQG